MQLELQYNIILYTTASFLKRWLSIWYGASMDNTETTETPQGLRCIIAGRTGANFNYCHRDVCGRNWIVHIEALCRERVVTRVLTFPCRMPACAGCWAPSLSDTRGRATCSHSMSPAGPGSEGGREGGRGGGIKNKDGVWEQLHSLTTGVFLSLSLSLPLSHIPAIHTTSIPPTYTK